MKKIKIAVNGKFLTVPATGVQRVAHETVLAMDKLLENDKNFSTKFDVVIIAPKGFECNVNFKKIKCIQKGLFSGRFKNNLWEQLSLPFIARGRLLVSMCNIAPIFVRNAAVVIHDAQVYTSPVSYSIYFKTWYKFALPMIGKCSKIIITDAEFGKKELIDFKVANKNKIHVNYAAADQVLNSAIDETILGKYQIKGRKFFVAQSNTQEHKNIKILLKAFSEAKLKDVFLVLYGNAQKNQFEVLGNNVPDNVIFTGRISDAQLYALFKNATATLTPSTTEGFGLQPLEGMALGTPAIISPCGALPEVCGDCALYSDAHDSNSWVTNIELLVNNPLIYAQYKQKALIKTEQFTWEKSAKNLFNIIEKYNN